PDAQAGATSPAGVRGIVQVIPLEKMAGPGTPPNLDGLASQHKATVLLADRRELSYETTTFAGHEARRYVIGGAEGNGTRLLGEVTLFVRGRFVYVLEVVGPADRCRPGDAQFRAFTGAVELTGGGT